MNANCKLIQNGNQIRFMYFFHFCLNLYQYFPKIFYTNLTVENSRSGLDTQLVLGFPARVFSEIENPGFTAFSETRIFGKKYIFAMFSYIWAYFARKCALILHDFRNLKYWNRIVRKSKQFIILFRRIFKLFWGEFDTTQLLVFRNSPRIRNPKT